MAGSSPMAMQIAESVQLLDIAQGLAGLLFDPAAQPCLQRTVPWLQRAGRQPIRRAFAGPDDQYPGFVVDDRDHDGAQADADRLRHHGAAARCLDRVVQTMSTLSYVLLAPIVAATERWFHGGASRDRRLPRKCPACGERTKCVSRQRLPAFVVEPIPKNILTLVQRTVDRMPGLRRSDVPQ